MTSIARTLPLSLSIAAAFTLIHLEMWVAAAVAAIVTVGVVAAVVPRDQWVSGGMDMKTTSETDFTQWDHIRPLLPGAIAILPGPWIDMSTWWPLYTSGVTGALMWGFHRQARRSAVLGRRRARRALELTSLEEATLPRLTAATEHRAVLRGLTELGAVDGIRARTWRLAQHLDTTVPEVHEEVHALERVGIVSVSSVDAGADISRHLVEVTPVGVRVIAEMRTR